MVVLVRRFLVLAALMFWQGGFTFYAAVVVPVGQAALGHADQALVTRTVTDYLNVSGAVALALLGWDVWATADPSVRRRQVRWLAWVVMFACLGTLAWLHVELVWQMDGPHTAGGRFRTGHRWYLWVSTLQWAAGVLYAVLTLAGWRATDRQSNWR